MRELVAMALLIILACVGCVSSPVYYRVETGEEFQGTIDVPSVHVEARGAVLIETHGEGLYLDQAKENDARPEPPQVPGRDAASLSGARVGEPEGASPTPTSQEPGGDSGPTDGSAGLGSPPPSGEEEQT